MPCCDTSLRRCDRWLPWLTLAVAVAWAFAASSIGSQVRQVNSYRACGALMLGSMGSQPEPPPPARHPGALPALPTSIGMLVAPASVPAGATQAIGSSGSLAAAGLRDLQRQTVVVEGVVFVWERAMYLVAAILAIAAVASRHTGRPRVPHLVAAIIVLLVTGGSLGALAYLAHPQGGGLPPLPIKTYVLGGLILSAYAWLLLAVYLRKGTVPAQFSADKLDDCQCGRVS